MLICARIDTTRDVVFVFCVRYPRLAMIRHEGSGSMKQVRDQMSQPRVKNRFVAE